MGEMVRVGVAGGGGGWVRTHELKKITLIFLIVDEWFAVHNTTMQ